MTTNENNNSNKQIRRNENDPPQYWDAVYCRSMAKVHQEIALAYHEDGWLEEYKTHMNIVKFFNERATLIEKGNGGKK